MEYIKLILILYFCLKSATSLDCFWNNQCKYISFSSKTPYENVRGDIRDSVVQLKNCEVASIWSYIRHGKRNPSERFGKPMKDVLEFKNHIIKNYEKGNSTICAQDIENLKNWTPENSLFTEPDKLNVEGYQELVGIANRLMETFPELLSDLRDDEYLFHPVFGKRMRDSAKGFIEGLKNKSLVIENVSDAYDNMAPYVTCEKYLKEVRTNPNIYDEVVKYQDNPDYLDTVKSIERKLGVKTTKSEIIALYDLCRYSWDGTTDRKSPWCALFTTKDLQVLEYISDMQHYYRTGYGNSYSKTFGQIVLADLFRRFESSKERKGKKMYAYFGHATVMDMILVALNVFKDEKSLDGEYRDSNRKWKTAKLSTFAGNLIAVLNKCKSAGDIEDYNIAFYLNENPLLELCNQGVCSWEQFENKFKPFLNTTTDFC